MRQSKINNHTIEKSNFHTGINEFFFRRPITLLFHRDYRVIFVKLLLLFKNKNMVSRLCYNLNVTNIYTYNFIQN